MSLFQYQALAEPLQVDAPVVTVYLDWSTQEPDRLVPRPRVRPGFFVQPIEPSLFTAPPELSWWQPAQTPSNPKRKHPPIEFVIPWEPSLFTAPPELSWWQPLQTPNNPKRKHPPTEFVIPWEPSLFGSPPELSWEPHLSQPVALKPRRFHEAFHAVFVVQQEVADVSWMQQASEPQRSKPRMAGTHYARPLEPSLTETPPPLSWWQPASQPTIRIMRSRTLTFEVRPLTATTFVIPSIAKYVATYAQIEGATYVYLQALHNLQAAVAPGINDDGSIGYAPGSIWIDKTLDNAFICVSAVPGAAVWKQID